MNPLTLAMPLLSMEMKDLISNNSSQAIATRSDLATHNQGLNRIKDKATTASKFGPLAFLPVQILYLLLLPPLCLVSDDKSLSILLC
jgi:hypothetical protein